jgi:hypothetical protein
LPYNKKKKAGIKPAFKTFKPESDDLKRLPLVRSRKIRSLSTSALTTSIMAAFRRQTIAERQDYSSAL